MRFSSSSVSTLSIAVVSLILAGCTAGPMANHGGHHGASKGTMGMGHKNSMSMCPMHGQMMGSKSPEEHKAMMAEHMKSMSPETRQQHLQRMQEHVNMMQEVMATLPAPGK
jgi:hypothetical protein